MAGRPDALVVAAFVLVCTGLLVKAAVVPFHFWTADAEAVAPTPVCVLFSGVMVVLGVYGTARVYWTAFSGSLEPSVVRPALVVLGSGTSSGCSPTRRSPTSGCSSPPPGCSTRRAPRGRRCTCWGTPG